MPHIHDTGVPPTKPHQPTAPETNRGAGSRFADALAATPQAPVRPNVIAQAAGSTPPNGLPATDSSTPAAVTAASAPGDPSPSDTELPPPVASLIAQQSATPADAGKKPAQVDGNRRWPAPAQGKDAATVAKSVGAAPSPDFAPLPTAAPDTASPLTARLAPPGNSPGPQAADAGGVVVPRSRAPSVAGLLPTAPHAVAGEDGDPAALPVLAAPGERPDAHIVTVPPPTAEPMAPSQAAFTGLNRPEGRHEPAGGDPLRGLAAAPLPQAPDTPSRMAPLRDLRIDLNADALGSVRIQMAPHAEGGRPMVMHVDKPELLAALMAHRGELGQAFDAAGVRGADGDMRFALARPDSAPAANFGQSAGGDAPLGGGQGRAVPSGRLTDNASGDPGAATGMAVGLRRLAASSGLDITI